ncbi:hypothetical protein [Streptomyces sp. KL2]|uniref:hypothetical protein n=1 Tax=Streptomyces sp. KL2 TaxID=3050126 RepID=UPI003979A90F
MGRLRTGLRWVLLSVRRSSSVRSSVGAHDDVLDAQVAAVELEDGPGGGGVAEPGADVLHSVGGRRDGLAVGPVGRWR